MNSDDVLRDLRKAGIEKRRVFVSRSENNGKIRWVIEIERSASDFGSSMKRMFHRLGQREERDEEEEWR